jgi:hypothetical protein
LRLASTAYVDRVDLVVEVFVVGTAKKFVACVGYLLAIGRVGRVIVALTVLIAIATAVGVGLTAWTLLSGA